MTLSDDKIIKLW